MAAGNQQFVNDASFSMAIVAAIGVLLLESKLESIFSSLRFVQLHEWAQWWPLLLVLAGAILMFLEPTPNAQALATARSQPINTQRGEK